MDHGTIAGLMQAIAPVVRQYLGEQLAGLHQRIAALEAREVIIPTPEPGPPGSDGIGWKDGLIDGDGHLCVLRSDGELLRLGRVRAIDGERGDRGEKGDPGPPGPPGEDADPLVIRSMVVEAVAELPPPRDGVDSKNVDPQVIRSLIDEAVQALPAPRDGIDGKDADPALIHSLVLDAVAMLPPAQDGADGKDADPELIKTLVDEAVAKLPPAPEGPQGAPGIPGIGIQGLNGEKGADGRPGVDGKDGVGILDLMTDDNGHARVLLTDGRSLDLGRILATDGKDADPEFVRSLVAQAVAELPPARDGVDGRDADPELIKTLITEAVAAIPPAPPGQKGDPGPQGERGADGQSVDPMEVRAMVEETVAKIPPPRDGMDGKDVDPAVIRSMVTEAVAALPPPRDGIDGKNVDPEFVRTLVTDAVAAIPPAPPGEKGEPGAAGRDGTDADATLAIAKMHDNFDALREFVRGEVDAIAASIPAAVEKATASLPRSFLVDGDGDLLVVARDGTVAAAGHVRGMDGATPAGVEDVDVDEDGNLVVRMSDNRLITRGRVKGRDGRDGEPGLGFEDMDWEYDGERTLTLRMVRNGQNYERSFTIPVVLDRGVWRPGEKYVAGDGVSFAGAFWVAQRQTDGKPGDGPDNGWRLAVKAARHGKSAFDLARAAGFSGTEKEWLASLKGPEGKQGPPGLPGRS